jgi:uncharacterized membrane protein
MAHAGARMPDSPQDMISPLPDAVPSAKRTPTATLHWRVRAAVAVRTVAAIGGGYLLASLATRALAITLPMAAVDAVVTATLTGLVVYPCAVMWCFAAATVRRACLGLVAACALPTLVILAHQSAAVAA